MNERKKGLEAKFPVAGLESSEEIGNAENAVACIAAGQRIGELMAPQLHVIEGVPHVVMPQGQELTSLEKLLSAPQRIQGERHFHEVAGFTNYVNQFKADGDSVVDATRLYFRSSEGTSAAAIRALLDDHAKDNPAWCDHCARLTLIHTDEWNAWMRVNKSAMGHTEFCEFLQEQMHTIAEPAGSDILDAARTFSAHRNAKFESVIPVEGGDYEIGYSEEVRGTTKTGAVALPSRLKLVLRPFRATKATYPVDVTVNWRLQGTELKFHVVLLRTERVLEQAVDAVRAEVEAAVGLPVLA